MKLSHFSVHRPVFVTMVTLIVAILGVVSFSRLPVDLMPDVSIPMLSISTSYENASPEEMEELVTRLIEESVWAVPGVEEVSSTSTEGNSNVRVSFTWGTDLDAATNDVRDRLDRVIPRLPDGADRPTLRKFDLAGFPVMILGASSRLDPVEMRRIIDEQVKYRIERVPGVAALDIWGGLQREIRVYVNPDRIKALGLSLSQVLGRIRAGNINLPAGVIDRGNYEVTIRTPGEYQSLDELRNTVIAERGGSRILLSQVAEVKDASQKITRIVRVNGEPGIRLSVSKQSGTNTVSVARGVLKEIENINRDIPYIRIIPIIDTSDFIQRSIDNVARAAVYGGLLAVLVLLLFLRSVRSTAIIAVSIPVSITAAFGLIYFAGFTLNLMTLGALALGVGMLVDSSIVVLENIYRLRETGQERLEAAVNGSSEVSAAVIASTVTTVAVFLPLIFVRGMAGVMFQQLAFVVSFSLLCSLAAALMLVPMLAGRLLPPVSSGATAGESLSNKFLRVTEALFRQMESAYKRLLDVALNHRLITALVALVLFGATLLLVPLVGTELMPESDEGEVMVDVEMEAGTRLGITDEKLRQVEEIVRKSVPEVQCLVSSTGGSPWQGSVGHTGSIRLSLVPQAERKRTSDAIAQDLRRRLSSIPGLTVRARAGQGFASRMMGRAMGAGAEKIQVDIRGHGLEVADELAKRVQTLIGDVRGITDVRVSRETGAPEELILIDRQKAADMKLTVQQIAETLQTVLSGSRASAFREVGDEYAIRVQVENPEQMDLRDILDLTIANVDGEPVVLRNVVEVRPRAGPVRIERKDKERTITVSANLAGRDMGSAIAEIREKLREVPVPRGFAIVFGGEYEEQQKAFRELLLGFVLALVLVYMVMACQYESLRDPFVVMFSVPFAGIGVVLILFLTRTTFNVQSFIGCIMLGGIVVNNAILLVDTTNLLRRRDGMELRAAIEEAGRRRLRPILMTALTTVIGLIPLALGLGEGGEAQAPMARAVVGGLVSSTLITLVLVPVVYSIFEHGLRRMRE